MVQVSIPVEKHVLKFLTRKYGQVHKASKTTLIGKMVLQALDNSQSAPDKVIPGTYKYELAIPEFYFNTKGSTLKPRTRQLLGDCFNILFDDEMCSHLDRQVMAGRKALTELKAFLEIYHITEDDVKVETLYKVYQRHTTALRNRNLNKNAA
ncbi:MAG: hypothetical protein EOO20_03235 [Chryseobacterium sp.]|nr:MAG: hypothetical protein EOO20_03235 [Chryseobacterium sp.]